MIGEAGPAHGLESKEVPGPDVGIEIDQADDGPRARASGERQPRELAELLKLDHRLGALGVVARNLIGRGRPGGLRDRGRPRHDDRSGKRTRI
jgi:hypothetical protein